MQSPYYASLYLLCCAAVSFQYPPSKIDKKVIAALRKNWSEMMDRVCISTAFVFILLQLTAPVDLERARKYLKTRRFAHNGAYSRWSAAPKAHYNRPILHIVSSVLSYICDRYLTGQHSVLYKPSDLTIQIIARHWKFAQTPPDTTLTASALNAMLDPEHPRLVAYIRSTGLEPSVSQVISKILVGVSPTAQSSKQQQVKTLMATFSEHLNRLTGRSAASELDLLMNVISAGASEPELAKILPKATPLWNAMFRLLKKSAKPATGQGSGAIEDPEEEMIHRRRIIANIVGTSANTLHNLSFKNREECESLVRIWGNENLLGALEETIELLVKIPGMTSTFVGFCFLFIQTNAIS